MLSTPLRRRMAWALVWASAAMFMLGVVAMISLTLQLATEVRDTQLEGTPLGQKLQTSADRILDCTSPEGECYKRGQERTAKAVGDINRVIVLAAACSVGLDRTLTVDERQVEIQQCVIDRLAQRAAKP